MKDVESEIVEVKPSVNVNAIIITDLEKLISMVNKTVTTKETRYLHRCLRQTLSKYRKKT